jgi:hypothetical protein
MTTARKIVSLLSKKNSAAASTESALTVEAPTVEVEAEPKPPEKNGPKDDGSL